MLAFRTILMCDKEFLFQISAKLGKKWQSLVQYQLIDEFKGPIGAYISNFSQIGQEMAKFSSISTDR